ncbi:transposase [Enterobacter hormaechei subsp. hoffmannii]|uniref:Transposase n=4 Tax=Enterobacteriaceae TaxID=543 RepID=A0ABD7ARL2_9ENTR|nr:MULTISPECIES: transposase [Enterobacteriaceae]AVU22118.1 hypothetical protein AO413_22100 [Enterobacter cloacae]EAA7460287.1 hypothetical protein [Salmonella enterica subsp. enterica serovar Havana]EKB2837989.1 transposase [Salmonella enterica]MCU2585378.1 transposase [Enterobacter hormaechei subsp. steigerwaltii]MCU3195446.1 transposase [Enterobacter hormaechei subsp. hoffmannii]MDT3761456.1 transposase [Citrobacter freundii complex sp. 2023EL-00962]MDT7472614.1 transposase [Citrobacter 
MSHQLTFADSEFSTKRRQTRKEIFLSRMEQILPWQNMTAVIEPFYPKAGNGRRPYPLETMLRIHCMQHWYMKASIRARVEHPFRIIKRQFGFVKARYKGLLKNDNQLAMLFTLANLFRVDQMIRQWERSQ